MAVNIHCPKCDTGLALDDALIGSVVECPFCGTRFEAPKPKPKSKPPAAASIGTPTKNLGPARRRRESSGKSRCPSCNARLSPGSVLCTRCGFHLKLKRRLQSAFIPEKKIAAGKTAAPPRPAVSTAVDNTPVAWGDILRAPVDVEFTLTETIELTIWSLFWVGLFAVLVGAMMLMGFGSILAVAAVIAGILRVWMLSRDLSIFDLLKIVGALFTLAIAIAYPLDWILPRAEGVDASRVPALTFEIILLMVFLCIFLRMISFFFGRYFAIVRRAAFRTLFSEEDRGGLVDMAYGLVVLGVAATPVAAVAVAAGVVSAVQGSESGEIDGPARLVVAALAAVAVAWLAFYLPMGAGVAALRKSVNPAVVFQWIGKILPEYLLLVALLLPFHVVVAALSVTTGHLLGQLGGMTRFGFLIDVIYAFFAGIVFSQYAMAVSCVSIGLLLRRHETHLDWRRWADSG